MKYIVLIWATEQDAADDKCEVYAVVETLGCALNTAVNLRQSGQYYDAGVAKIL